MGSAQAHRVDPADEYESPSPNSTVTVTRENANQFSKLPKVNLRQRCTDLDIHTGEAPSHHACPICRVSQSEIHWIALRPALSTTREL